MSRRAVSTLHEAGHPDVSGYAWPVQPIARLYLRRKRRVLVDPGTDTLPIEYVATAVKNLERLGYTASPRLIERLQTLSERDLAMLYGEMVSTLREMKGAGVAWTPMYPNFPRQVMEASEAELYINALMHYFGDAIGARILPKYDTEKRPPLPAIEAKLDVIELGDPADLRVIARELIGAATSISAQDKDDLRALVAYLRDDAGALLPERIPHKENLAFTATLLLDHPLADVLLTRFFKTATDVLRLAAALSDADVSLAKPPKLRAFKRPVRRLLLALVDRVPSPDEDIWRRREVWLRLGERLHPGEHAKRFPKAAAAFARLRAGERPQTFRSTVEAAIRARDVPAALAILRTRPGELARRLDQLMRIERAGVVEAFAAVAGDVATPVLLQVLAHFEHEPAAVRPIFPKGNAAKVVALPETRRPLDGRAVVAACETALRARFAKLPPLGRVYVDPKLASYLVPFSQRSASKALRTLVRGSRIPLPAGSTLRFFLWWKEGPKTGRVDIDLTGAMYDDAFQYKEHISWTSLRSSKFRGAHSGDITSAPNGACEFIDIDIASARACGYRYCVALAYAFTSQPYCDLPQCFTGWMMRADPASGEIFEPATVVDKVDLAADERACVPAIFDLVKREVMWTDVAHKQHPHLAAAIESNRSTVGKLVEAMASLHRANLYRLFSLHAAARGTRVDHPKRATTVFGVDQAFELDRIMAEYLA